MRVPVIVTVVPLGEWSRLHLSERVQQLSTRHKMTTILAEGAYGITANTFASAFLATAGSRLIVRGETMPGQLPTGQVLAGIHENR